MTWIVLIAAAAAPTWTSDLNFLAKRSALLILEGEAAPGDLMHIPRGSSAVLRPPANTSVTLELYGIMVPQPRNRWSPPGMVALRHGKNRHALRLEASPKAWQIHKRPRWRLGKPVTITLDPLPVSRPIRIQASPLAQRGFALRVIPPPSPNEPADERPTTAATQTPKTEQPTTEGSPVAANPETTEEPVEAPTLAETPENRVFPVPPVDAEDDIELITTPFAALDDPVLVGASVVEPKPPLHGIVGPDGAEEFYHVRSEQPFRIQAVGPGTLVVHFHAHREENRPVTLEPLVVGVLLNEVLVQTVSLDQPGSERYNTAAQTSFRLARRATLRLPLPAGAQNITLSLSDNAEAGASINIDFEAFDGTQEPELLTAEERQDLRAAEPLPEVQGGASMGLLVGMWLPTVATAPGIALQLEGDLGIPVVGSRLSVGVFAAVHAARLHVLVPAAAHQDRPDPTLTLLNVPLGLDVRATAPLPQPFRMAVGMGGGLNLGWNQWRDENLRPTAGPSLSPLVLAHLTIGVAVGPGSLVLRGQYSATTLVSHGALRDANLGGATILFGFQAGGTM